MDNLPIQPAPEFNKGERLTAEKLNRAIGNINRLAMGVKPIEQVIPSGSGAEGPQGSNGSAGYYRFIGGPNGYWIGVQTIDNAGVQGPQVYAALPFLLRQSITTRGGNSLTYQSGSQMFMGTVNQTFNITPAYVSGDLLFCSAATATGVQDPSGNYLTLLDMNTDARAWGFQNP